MDKPDHPVLSPKNFWRLSSYMLLLGVLSAVLVDLNKDKGWIPPVALAIALSVIVLIAGYQLLDRLRQAWNRGNEIVKVFEKQTVREAVALIVFVSQGSGRTSALQAAGYHASGGILKHLWLITTRDAQADAEWVKEQIRTLPTPVQVHEIFFLDDKDNIQEAKAAVEYWRRRAMEEVHIPEQELICDFTGLTKNASAGMILACAPKSARLQYMVPNRRTEDGRADTLAGSSPREVFTQYIIVEEK